MKTIIHNAEQMPGWSIPFSKPRAAKGTTMVANTFAIIDTEHHLAEQVEEEKHTSKIEKTNCIDCEVSR